MSVMWRVVRIIGILVVVGLLPEAEADDLTGATAFLCAPVQATVCAEDGECAVDLPWNVNVPQFIEVDLVAGRLGTTAASGEGRSTAIEHLSRHDGKIVFHGYEMGRAFSWVIDERTGRVTAAVATDGLAVSVFGACTPMPAVTGTTTR
ncbi:MAG: hypothetical protein MUC56_14645 [Thermoanaerobaculales bacterium]|nr:hypothetical protein [Thermoanaerobaculales bacterium]